MQTFSTRDDKDKHTASGKKATKPRRQTNRDDGKEGETQERQEGLNREGAAVYTSTHCRNRGKTHLAPSNLHRAQPEAMAYSSGYR